MSSLRARMIEQMQLHRKAPGTQQLQPGRMVYRIWVAYGGAVSGQQYSVIASAQVLIRFLAEPRRALDCKQGPLRATPAAASRHLRRY